MRVVFLGTSNFAVEVLKKLVSAHEIAAVISQPDRAKDRLGNFVFTPVKSYALSQGLPVLQFEKIRFNAAEIAELSPEVMVTAAYGQILSREILDIPKYGVLNVHASLLPRYRGSSPIQSAILRGEKKTGVSIMQTVFEMDAGDVLAVREIEIGNMTAGELSQTLSAIGGELLLEVLDSVVSGNVVRHRQDEAMATFCKKFTKEDARIMWNMPAEDVYNTIRAFNPDPGAFTVFGGDKRMKIFAAERAEGSGEPGKVLCADTKNGLVIACGSGALRIVKLQTPGKNIMTDTQFLNGNKIAAGDYFGY